MRHFNKHRTNKNVLERMGKIDAIKNLKLESEWCYVFVSTCLFTAFNLKRNNKNYKKITKYTEQTESSSYFSVISLGKTKPGDIASIAVGTQATHWGIVFLSNTKGKNKKIETIEGNAPGYVDVRNKVNGNITSEVYRRREGFLGEKTWVRDSNEELGNNKINHAVKIKNIRRIKNGE